MLRFPVAIGIVLLVFSPTLALPEGPFTEPRRLVPEGQFGYEPGIKVGPDGTLYAFIHKGDPVMEASGRLASFVSYSKDGGDTWTDMPSPLGVHTFLFAFENDIAIDADNVVYNVDTYLVDNTITRWQAGAEEPDWLDSRPAMATTHQDDRPWLATSRAGVLHYLGSGNSLPAMSILDGSLIQTQMWYASSTDGGLTWSPQRGVPSVGFCHVASGSGEGAMVYIACYDADRKGFSVFESADEGATWARASVIRGLVGAGPLFPSSSVAPDGSAYAVLIDDIPGAIAEPYLPIFAAPQPNPDPARLLVGVRAGPGAWTTMDVTPFVGTFVEPWIATGPEGQLAVVFYGAHDINVHAGTIWHAYALTWCAATPELRTLALVDEVPAVTGMTPPGHFLEGAVGLDGAVHVVYDRMQWNFIIPGFMNNPDLPSVPHHVRSTSPLSCAP